MNINKTRVPTEFGPETRFELRATPDATFRATRETDFERLKTKLLAERLAEAKPERNALLRRAANEAAALAWVTFHPLLAFPVLFEEKTAVALRQAQQQARIYAHSRELLAA